MLRNECVKLSPGLLGIVNSICLTLLVYLCLLLPSGSGVSTGGNSINANSRN